MELHVICSNNGSSVSRRFKIADYVEIILFGTEENITQFIQSGNQIYRCESYTSCVQFLKTSVLHANINISFILLDHYCNQYFLYSSIVGFSPLYYAIVGDRIYVSNSFTSFVMHGVKPMVLNKTTIYEFLAFGFHLPPDTLIEGVKFLPAGYCLKIENKQFKTEVIKSNLRNKWTRYNINTIADLYYKRLEDAVNRQLEQDNNIVLSLSGGIDSIALAYIMKKMGLDFKCLTLDFSNGANYCEINNSMRASELFCLKQEIIQSYEEYDLTDVLYKAIRCNEYPVNNAITEYILGQELAKRGETIITGNSNDLIWGAFPISNHMNMTKEQIVRYYVASRNISSYNILEKLLNITGALDSVFGKIQFFYNELEGANSNLINIDTILFGCTFCSNSFSKLRQINENKYKFPYRDYELQCFIKSTKNRYSYYEEQGRIINKYLFKLAIMRNTSIPHNLIHSQKSWLFSNNKEWLRRELKELLMDTIYSTNSLLYSYFDINLLKVMTKMHMEYNHDFSNILMCVLQLEIMCKYFKLYENSSIKY